MPLYVRVPRVHLRVARGVGDIAALAAGVKQIEGYIPPNAKYPQGSLAYQNNNPGNIMYIGQPGAVLGAGGFARWPTYEAGYQGLLDQINANAASGMTLSEFTCHYAGCARDCTKCPPGANNTAVYLDQLQRSTGASADTPLTSIIAGSGGGSIDMPTGDYFPEQLAGDGGDGGLSDAVVPIAVGIGLLGALWLFG